MNSLKSQLYEKCRAYIEERVHFLSRTITEIQLSANAETKSSAGDKYETARAMAQLEVEQCQAQLAEALKMKDTLLRISVENHTQIIRPGSLVFTSRGNFYIAVNAGKLILNGQNFFALSASAPLAQKLLGLRPNDAISFNRQGFSILEVQ